MAATLHDISVNIGARRPACVLDPTLALSPLGLPLVRRLCHGMEMWLVRELWHILDDSRYYLQRPDALWEGEAGAGVIAGGGEDLRLQQVLRTLRGWEQIRLCTDLSGLKCCWIGDGLAESLIPEDRDASLVARYEWLSALLDARIDARGTLANCFRDVAALAAALETVLVLTQVIDQEPPAIAQALGRWGVPCRQISTDDRLCALESGELSTVLVQAGIAKLAWAGLRLAVLHVVAPGALLAPVPLAPELAVAGEGGDDGFGTRYGGADEDADADPWLDAQAFWYPL
jgi:hypothetical protein